MMECPFGHKDAAVLDTITAKDLKAAYRRKLNVDIDGEITRIENIELQRCQTCAIEFFSPAIAGSEYLYAQLASRNINYYSETKEEFRIAAEHIKPDASVLEVGCGRGHFAKYIPGRNYIGLEFNRSAAATARERGIDVRTDDLMTFSKQNPGAFDAACAFQVLEHVPDPASFIAACAASVKVGGLLVFGTPNAGAYLGLQPDEILDMPPHHLTRWSETAYRNIAPTFGLSVEAVEEPPLVYRDQFTRGIILQILRRKLRMRPKQLFFNGPVYRVLNGIAGLVAPIILLGIYDPRLMPRGHLLLAILRKQN